MRSDTCILLPSANRPEKLTRCLDSIGDSADVTLSLLEGDGPRDVATIITRNQREYKRGAVWAWNQCLRETPNYEFYVLGADDLVFHPGWLSAAKEAWRELNGCGLVALNDTHSNGDEYAAHWMADRDFIANYLGGVMYPPMYASWWADREVSDIAKEAHRYIYAQRAVVEHFHYSFGNAPMDDTYREAQRHHNADYVIYQTRKAEGFPQTWQRILV